MLPPCHNNKKLLFPHQAPSPFVLEGLWTGQTGRAGRTETEYYHWGESCFMLLSSKLWALSQRQTEQSSVKNSKQQMTSMEAPDFLLPLTFFYSLISENCTPSETHLLTASFSCSPSMGIARSISHFTASYTFLCHSQPPVHSSSRLGQQRRPQGSCLSLPLLHTNTHTHIDGLTVHTSTHSRYKDSSSYGAARSLTGALCSSVSRASASWRYLQSTTAAPWKEGFTQLWNIDARRAPGEQWPFDLSLILTAAEEWR